MSSHGTVLLTGATGHVGGRLLPLLVEEGRQARCQARRAENLIPRLLEGVRAVPPSAAPPAAWTPSRERPSRPKVKVAPQVRPGSSFRVITKAASDFGADLIFLATVARTGLRRALIGSVDERVVRHAPCPVLVVR